MLTLVDPDQDPEEEELMTSEMFRGMDPEKDMKNAKLKEETRNMLSGSGYFGFTFLFL